MIGRDETCDLTIDDLSVSRRHARIEIALPTRQLSISDLGSSNGTFVAGRRIDAEYPTPLVLGSVVGIGSATVVLQGAPSFSRVRPLRSHSYFQARVEDECARAADSGQRFTIARLESQASARLEATLSQWLRPMDVVARYAPNRYDILFTDTAHGPAMALVDRLKTYLDSVGARTNAVFSVYPDDARTPEALLEVLEEDIAQKPQSFLKGTLQRLSPVFERASASSDRLLVMGETGTGKEIIARHIHARSARARRPFIVVSCASLPDAMLETELVGYERGAFAGAFLGETGALEKGEGGTVFLDEVADIPPQVQATLLRILETGSVTRLGAPKSLPIDARLIAATSRDLEDEVACGSFREDLYFRLAGMTIIVPPLRDRLEDIAPLAEAFLRRTCQRLERKAPALSPATLDALNGYSWPGNVRELKNVMDRAAYLATGPHVLPEHLPLEKMGPPLREQLARPLPPRMRDDRPTLVPNPTESSAPPSARAPRTRDHRLLDSQTERARIQQALDSCSGNQTHAARVLGMSRRTLLNRLEEYGLPRPRKDRRD